MNLVDGKILDADECDAVLNNLEQRIIATLSKPRLEPEQVIKACDIVVSTLDEPVYLSAMDEFGIPQELSRNHIAEARAMFSAEALHSRMQKEFGEGYDEVHVIGAESEHTITEQILPLGVLLHIAAGNADGLPAFSVFEGLLTGNINILKLPAAESGISVSILMELIRIEPMLAEYIYVFDYAFKDMVHMNKLIHAADAVTIWGGIESVTAVRSLLPPNIKLIEWGHKISFAYVTKDGLDEELLYGIAANIASTGQLLCSSCQGIFLDTSDMSEVYAFCERFLPLLEKAVSEYAGNMDIGFKAQAALQCYTAELESIFTENRIFCGRNCNLVASKDQILEPSTAFGSVWIKMLSREQLLKTLRPYKNYLQTVALACGEREKTMLSDLFLKTGVVRICSGRRMSATYPGAPHDGEFSLRRYTKIASLE